MALTTVQNKFVQEAARPHLEVMIRILHELDTYIADYDAIQASPDAIPEDTVDLDDGRTDAPAITGADLKTLRDKGITMSAVITPAVKTALVGKMVRSLSTVLKLN